MVECEYWPLSRIHDILGYVAYHATDAKAVSAIRKVGLGDPIKNWTAGEPYEHHTWYFYCALDDDRKDRLHEHFGEPPFHNRKPSGWDQAVFEELRDQHPDAYMTWVSEKIENVLQFGSIVVEVMLEDLKKVDGFMFPDNVFGWAIVTVGKRIPKKNVYVLTKKQIESSQKDL